MRLRALFFRKALHLDLDSFGDNGSAGLTSRLTNDIANVTAGLTVLLGRLLREPLKMVVCLVAAFCVCPRLLLLVMVVTPLLALVINYLSRAIRRASRKAMEEMSQLYGMLNDAFAGIRVVKAFNTQAYERAKFKTSHPGLFWQVDEDGLLQHAGSQQHGDARHGHGGLGNPGWRVPGPE